MKTQTKARDKENEKELFGQIRDGFLEYDPAYFIQNNLVLDGKPFSILENGWKFMCDIYRYIAHQATRKDGKPVVICKGRQVGATMMAGALDLYFTNSKLFSNPPIRVAHLFPTQAMSKRFSQDKLEELIRGSKNDFINKNKLKSRNVVDNLTMKQFETGTLWIESIGEDADRIRGMTCDVLMLDEIQDYLGLSVGNATKTLTAAKYGAIGKGVQVYFGTPKEKNSYFNSLWDMSDQRYYHFGCKGCKQTFPFYQSGSEFWKELWVSGYIIKCPHCGLDQHKIEAIEHGKWVPNKDSDKCKYVGFHINQLYIPNFTRENILDLMPENNPTQLERIWNNEVLGEFYSGAGLPLTKAEIYEKCRDADRSFSKRLDLDPQKPAYMGIDWGGKVDNDSISRGQSYSCVVILSAQSDGTLLVEHAHKLKEQTLNYKKETVNEMFKRFNLKRSVADIGYGHEIANEMQLVYRDKFLAAQASGNALSPLKFREDELIITYNKDILIDEVFEKLRKGQIRFPWKSYEYIEWLLDHCVSMEMGTKLVNGQQVKHFRKGNVPNDGLMALMYAYIAWKFDATSGFTIKPGMDKQSSMPRSSLAYTPRFRF